MDNQIVSTLPLGRGPSVLVGLDVEWKRHPTNPLRNQVIAYGVKLDVAGRACTLVVHPSGPDHRHRLQLNGLLGRLFARAISESVIANIPDRIVLLMHFGRGDLAAFRDFALLKTQVDAVKGVFATTGKPLKVSIQLDEKTGLPLEALPKMPGERVVNISDSSGVAGVVCVTFRDTSALVVEGVGKSLEMLGELVGVPKLRLPDGYDKSDMGRFFAERPAEAEAYLRRDLDIPIRYFRRFEGLVNSMGISETPATLGSLAVRVFSDTLADVKDASGAPLTLSRVFATRQEREKAYSSATGRFRTVTKTEISVGRRVFEVFAGVSYLGGRTETYETGPTPAGVLLNDIDLKSAYPTAMAGLRLPDYGRQFMTGDLSLFTADTLGMAEVAFECPPGLRFPVFPLSTDHGLVFPRRGTAVVTAPEIATACNLDVEVKILQGAIIPWSDDPVLPYLEFFKRMLLLRESLKEEKQTSDGHVVRADSLPSLVIKTVANSLYGKTAQGVRDRNAFDSRTGGYKKLPPSAVTSPVFAAYTTGLVRAAVAEMLNSVPDDQMVVSVSTDGFLTSASPDVISLSGPSCRVMAINRSRLTGGDGALLEIKKKVRQVVVPRSRAAFTAMPVEGSKPVTAKGSIKLPKEVTEPDDFLIGLYINRDAGTTIRRSDLIHLRAQYKADADLVDATRSIRVNLEPDFKRSPTAPRMVEIGGGAHSGSQHLALSSQPYDTMDDMRETRALFEGWRHSTGRCLKALSDWEDWEDYRDAHLAARRSGKRSYRTAGGSSDDLKRRFLRALARSEWGLASGGATSREIADWLTAAGYRTGVQNVKDAGRLRATLIPHSVAATDGALALLLVILQRYPTFDYRRAFVAGHIDKVEAALGKRRKSP